MTSQLPVTSLCKTIKALVAKGDHAAEKAEQFYTAAGKHLAELKERCPGEWLQFASEKIGIGRSRAYELMAIGTGVRTVEQVRETTRRRVEHHRSRPLRNGRVRWIHEETGEECPDFVPPSADCLRLPGAWRYRLVRPPHQQWPGLLLRPETDLGGYRHPRGQRQPFPEQAPGVRLHHRRA